MAQRNDSNRDAVNGVDSVGKIARQSWEKTKMKNSGLRKIEMPSYQEGTPLVQEDQVAQLHEGEAVIPKEDNPNATELKPLVRSSAEKERARQIVEHPGVPTIQMGPAEDELIKPRDM